LANELSDKGFDVYIMEAKVDSVRYYRVRVGKLSGREEAEELQGQLSLQGYPTIIYP
jgi:cell division septation protein DedD